jgi:hypothetical protein
MAGSKRSQPSEDPPPQRRVRPRSSAQAPNLPTPDDALSVAELSAADPGSSSTSSPAEKKVPTGPANPGIVRRRDEGVLLRLPPDSDALEEFAKLRKDPYISDEGAFMKFMTTNDVPLTMLNQISSNVYPILLHR